jgi:hypothetical protein
MLIRGVLLLGCFIWRCADLDLSWGFTEAHHTVRMSVEFTSVVVELQNFFIKGLAIGSSGSWCYVTETAVDEMFNLQISHIQKFAWPFCRHIIVSDNVRCSHIKKLRRAKNIVFFKMWFVSTCHRKTFPAPSVNLEGTKPINIDININCTRWNETFGPRLRTAWNSGEPRAACRQTKSSESSVMWPVKWNNAVW